MTENGECESMFWWINYCEDIHYIILNESVIMIIICKEIFNMGFLLSECAKHCSLCYNETECYECTQGYFLNDKMECESKNLFGLFPRIYMQ